MRRKSITYTGQKPHTNWDIVDAMTDEEIDFSDIPEEGEEWFKNAELWMPQPKAVVTMRLDPEVLEWFKADGPGYQTRINALLWAYIDAHPKETLEKVDKLKRAKSARRRLAKSAKLKKTTPAKPKKVKLPKKTVKARKRA